MYVGEVDIAVAANRNLTKVARNILGLEDEDVRGDANP